MEPEEVKKHCQEILEINHLFVAQAYGFIARALFMEGKYLLFALLLFGIIFYIFFSIIFAVLFLSLKIKIFWECIDSCTEALKRDATLFRVFKVRSSAYPKGEKQKPRKKKKKEENTN